MCAAAGSPGLLMGVVEPLAEVVAFDADLSVAQAGCSAVPCWPPAVVAVQVVDVVDRLLTPTPVATLAQAGHVPGW